MKKLFLVIGIIALVIILVAGIIAILSILNLLPIIPPPPELADSLDENQVTILVAHVDTIETTKYHVMDVWLVYFVASRMDTALIESEQALSMLPGQFPDLMTEQKLVRQVEKLDGVKIDYILLIDNFGITLVNELLETQQSSIITNDSDSFCEILSDNKAQLLAFYEDNIHLHVKSSIPDTVVEQIAQTDNSEDSIYCESIVP